MFFYKFKVQPFSRFALWRFLNIMKKIVHKFVVMEKSLNSHAIWETQVFIMTDATTIAQSKNISHVQNKTKKVYVHFVMN